MSVQTTTTPSGLRIVTDKMEGVETAAIGVQVAVGSRHESARQSGLSHLIEHMAFKGTRRRSALAIAEEIESAGGDLNAATASEHTTYHARVLPEDVGLALDIFSDILQESLFDADELEREKGVILQEISAAEDTPDDVVFEVFDLAAFPDQSLGRPILGSAASVSAFTSADMRDYLATHYGANTLIISAAGAVEHEAVAATAEKLFGALPKVAPAPPAPARYIGGDAHIKRSVEQANLVIGFESVGHLDPDNYAAHIYASAIGGGMASRLFQEVREKRGLAYSIYAFNWSFADTGLFGLHAAASPADAGELAKVALDCLAASIEDLSEGEARRAKAQMKVSLLTALESSAARADQIARQTDIFGRVLTRKEIVANIDALSVEDIRRVGRRLLTSRPTVATIGPKGALLSKAVSAEKVSARLRLG